MDITHPGAGPPPEMDEDSTPQNKNFAAELVGLWEQAAEGVDRTRIRHVRLRIRVVLGAVDRSTRLGKLWRIGRSRGLLPIIRAPFCLGLGASIGTGRQMLPWVHIDDMVGIPLDLLDLPDLEGRFNAVWERSARPFCCAANSSDPGARWKAATASGFPRSTVP